MKENSKIAVSGTFSTGKTSLVKALNLITGIPALHSKSITQLQRTYLPEISVEKFSPFEYSRLNLWRFCEQLKSEYDMKSGFWADDFLLHQYIYGIVRMGAYRSLHKKAISRLYEQIGQVFMRYALDNYHSVIHLPLEYHAVGENAPQHNESIRKNCDALLIHTIESIGINHFIVTGNLEQRLEKVIKIFGIKPLISIQAALQAMNRA